MRHFLVFAFLMCVFAGFSQNNNITRSTVGTINVTSTITGTGPWTCSGTYTANSNYTIDSVAVGQYLVVSYTETGQTNPNWIWLRITSRSVSGATLTITVANESNVPNVQGPKQLFAYRIVKPTSRLLPAVDSRHIGANANLALLNRGMARIDSLLGVAGDGNGIYSGSGALSGNTTVNTNSYNFTIGNSATPTRKIYFNNTDGSLVSESSATTWKGQYGPASMGIYNPSNTAYSEVNYTGARVQDSLGNYLLYDKGKLRVFDSPTNTRMTFGSDLLEQRDNTNQLYSYMYPGQIQMSNGSTTQDGYYRWDYSELTNGVQSAKLDKDKLRFDNTGARFTEVGVGGLTVQNNDDLAYVNASGVVLEPFFGPYTTYSPGQITVGSSTPTVVIIPNNTGDTITLSSGGGDPTMGGDLSGTASNAQIVAGAVGSAELASNAVTTAKITDANVTTAKLADAAITTAKLADGAVVTVDIADNAVTTAKIADATITTADIANNAITTAKLSTTGVTAGSFTNANITILADGRVSAASNGSGGVTDPLSLTASNPAAPAGNTVMLFRQEKAEKQLLATKDSFNVIESMQPFLGSGFVAWYKPNPSGGSFDRLGTDNLVTTNHSLSGITPDAVNFIRRTARVRLQTNTGVGLVGHVRSQYNGYSIGNGTLGGFFCTFKFALSGYVATQRFCLGLRTSAVPTNVQPSTLTNFIGIGFGASDTTFQIYSAGSTPATPINLGINFPSNVIGELNVYEVSFYAPRTESKVYYQVERLNTGQVASGVLSGTPGVGLPGTTQMLAFPWGFNTANTVSASLNLDISGFYIKTEY